MTLPNLFTFVVGFFVILCVSGCSTAQPGGVAQRPQAPGESSQEVVSAMEHVLGSVSGQEVDEKRLLELNREIQKDPETKSAVEAISNSVSGQGAVIKYCPVDGERYSQKFELCPVHHVSLKILNE